jgi:hypothetical protein
MKSMVVFALLVVGCSPPMPPQTVMKIHDAQTDCQFIYDRDTTGAMRALARGCICSGQHVLMDYSAPLFQTSITCDPTE